MNEVEMVLLIKELLKEAIIKCYSKDELLIKRNMEQASVARIFYYMQEAINRKRKYQALRTLNLDCEYYKTEECRKIIEWFSDGTRPDIILHERDTHENNILMVEFKSHTGQEELINGIPKDKKKLIEFTKQGEKYKYKLGVFVRLNHNGAEYTYFQNGEEIEEERIC